MSVYFSGFATSGAYNTPVEITSVQDFMQTFGRSDLSEAIQVYFADPNAPPLFFQRNIGTLPDLEPDWPGFRNELVTSPAWIRISGAADVGVIAPFVQLLFALSDSSILGEIVALWQTIKTQTSATQQELALIREKAVENKLPQSFVDAI